jgi:hypothetical protein
VTNRQQAVNMAFATLCEHGVAAHAPPPPTHTHHHHHLLATAPPAPPNKITCASAVGVSVDPSVVGRDWSPVSSNKARGYCCRTPGDH